MTLPGYMQVQLQNVRINNGLETVTENGVFFTDLTVWCDVTQR